MHALALATTGAGMSSYRRVVANAENDCEAVIVCKIVRTPLRFCQKLRQGNKLLVYNSFGLLEDISEPS